MRITTGKYKGRVIKMPKGIRPTQNKARKALFDILGDIEGLSFLELFAGSGAVGIEALSRGASELVLVEKDPAALAVLKQNLRSLGLVDSMVFPKEAEEAVKIFYKRKKRFNLIFLDPPYYNDLAKKTLQMLSGYDILAPNGLAVAQHFKKEILPGGFGRLKRVKEAGYGETILSLYILTKAGIRKHVDSLLPPE